MKSTHLGGLERVEEMIMKRKLRCLGYLERMEDSHLPESLLVSTSQEKQSLGGQRRRWNDLVMSDLRKCDPLVYRREISRKRAAW